MTTFQFDYDAPPRTTIPKKPTRKRTLRRAKAILFSGDGYAAYYYDLKTRYPVAARIKRLFDVTAATAAITLLSPLLLVLMLLIKLTSPGPLIFRQRRIGFRANQFDMYKFRTMYDGSHLKERELAATTDSSFLKIRNDPRITPIGHFLRKYSLDELPQLFNVLEGTMSLVGPRPLLLSDLGRLPRRSPLGRFAMPPGLTGLWQVSGRSDCSELQRMRLDREYVDRWSLSLDFQILLRTIAVVMSGRGSV
jgi:lipopolysaccharide/colanic/teichoic acid biosynthesis glycosyltransferase